MSNKTAQMDDIQVFKRLLSDYKDIIDSDIAVYSKQFQHETLQCYGASARLVTDAYLEILARGGKRIRGSLVMMAYEMCGGQDKAMIVQVARALEMTHAYLLIMDDIQDRSMTRRGGPTAPVMLADYHKKEHLAGDDEHFGIALSLNAMGIGNHSAQSIMANIPVEPDLRLSALKVLNDTIITTAHGQTIDIMNEVVASTDSQDLERVLEWKTAHYTFLNPLLIGMILAGIDQSKQKAVFSYAIHAGKAFQITDDILGVFGTEFESGKSPMDDMREGKRTVLTTYALEHTTNGNKNFLLQMLGNNSLSPAEFERCKDILLESGALEYAKKRAGEHVEQALDSLGDKPKHWNNDGIRFLRGLAQYLLTRTS